MQKRQEAAHDGTIVVWRTWLVREDQRAGEPILTGLHGFRWPKAEMDAKCVLQEASHSDPSPTRHKLDRHHRVIPDPDCTCGIYAGNDELTAAREPLPPRSVPFVTGFVSLAGRVLNDGRMLRAQHATIIGPLNLVPGRRPRWHRIAPAAAASLGTRITTDRGAYRTLWTNRPLGEDAGNWLAKTADALTARYGAAVVIAAD